VRRIQATYLFYHNSQKNPKNKGPVACERSGNYLSNTTGFITFGLIKLGLLAEWCTGVKQEILNEI
jgi:hypothetical protein